VVGTHSLDPWECFYKGGGHLAALELRGGQHKDFYVRRGECRSLSDSISDAIIPWLALSNQATDFNEPNFVFSVRSKVVVMNLNRFADFPKGLSYDLSTKGTVDEKD
jgi:hypothetical protein